MMVNNQNPYMQILPDLPPPPVEEDSDECFIRKAPLWQLDELQDIARRNADGAETLKLLTRKCQNDVKRLKEESGGFDLAAHLLQLRPAGYDKSLWCRTSPEGARPGFWLPCDAYRLTVPFEHPDTGWKGSAHYYFKMAKALTGKLVLFVSAHPSK